MMRWCGIWVGMVAALACASICHASEPGESASPIAFDDPAGISTTCAELAKTPLKVPISNETAVAQQVTVEIDLTEKGNPVSAKQACGGLTLERAPTALGPGRGAMVELAAASDSSAGTFAGSIVVYAEQGRVARKKIEIGTSKPSTRELDMTPKTPSVSAEIGDSGEDVVWVAVQPQEPAPAEDGHGTEATTVGALSGPNGPVAVVYNGKEDSVDTGVSKIGLELKGDLEPGTYSGEVDLAPKDKEKGAVKLEVKVKESGWLAAALIFVGIVLGILLLRASGRMVPAARLEARVGALEDRYAKAREALKKEADAAAGWQETKIGDLDQIEEDLTDQIRDAKRKAVVKIEPKAIENIEAAIAVAEAQIDLLKEISKHAQGVEKALQLPRAIELPELKDKKGQERPKLETEVLGLIAGGDLPAEELKPRMEAMDAGAKQVRELRGLESALEELWLAERLLRGDTRTFESRLVDCRRRLWTLADAAGLAQAGEDIQAAREELVKLQAEQQPLLPPQIAPPPFAPWFGHERGVSVQGFAQLAGGTGSDETSAPTPVSITVMEATPQLALPKLPPQPLEKQKIAEAVKTARMAQIFVVLAAVLVALASGLGVLYVGKTWGTAWDYLAAVVWGLGAQTTVAALATSLDEFSVLSWFRRT